MKKFLIAAALAVAFSVQAFYTTNLRVIPAAAPRSTIAAGTAVTNAAVAVRSFQGIGDVAALYTAAATSCVFSVTLQTTNTVVGGWTDVNTTSATGTTSGLVRLPFAGADLTGVVRVIMSAAGANATGAAAVVLSY